jgi:hypothetical protein
MHGMSRVGARRKWYYLTSRREYLFARADNVLDITVDWAIARHLPFCGLEYDSIAPRTNRTPNLVT